MSTPVRLAAFAAAIAAALGLGLGIGQAVGPLDDADAGTPSPATRGWGNHDHP